MNSGGHQAEFHSAECINQHPAISVKNLGKHFGASKSVIFENISFDIAAGLALAIIGPNGAGKSTLIKCCIRLIEPDTGTVWLNGRRITGLSSTNLRQSRTSVGFVFQKHQLIPQLSALTNVLHGALANATGPRYWFYPLAAKAYRERAMHCLHQVGLADQSNHLCSQLSGGQSQRVAIARALMQDPRVILADEPTASLDPKSAEEIMILLKTLSQQAGITLVFVSHHIEHAKNYGDRIIGLKNRTLQLDTPTASIDLKQLKAFFSESCVNVSA